MIIWRGYGILSLLIIATTTLSGKLTASLLDHMPLKIAVVFGLYLVGAAANWFVGRAFNRPLEQAGVGYWKRHQLLFIQMEWWSLFLVFVLVASSINLILMK